MSNKQPNGDRWSRGFNKAVNSLTHAPKNMINSARQTIHDEFIPFEHDIEDVTRSIKDTAYNTSQNVQKGVNAVKNAPGKVKETASNIKSGAQNTASTIKDIANAKGLKGKANVIAGKFKGTETFKKMMDAIKAAIDAVKWVVANAKPILIVSAVILVLGNAIIIGIAIVQSVSATPHYYCNTEATASIKKTAVYQQYCTDISSFQLDNLNGHYIIQDGSGPCTDCSMNNMFMRYYSIAGINYFDYLWKEDGQYSPDGQIVESTELTVPATLRQVINGGAPGITSTNSKENLLYGTRAFATRNGKTITMANWGYLRDSSLDIASYEQTSDYYIDNSSNEKWVWDLSLNDRTRGTTWDVNWDYTMKLANIPCVVVTIEGNAITGETIKNVLAGQNDAVGEAGVVMYYEYPKSSGGYGQHAVLITDFDDNTNVWRVIDPAKGVNGGFEGPMDYSQHFAIHDYALDRLLNANVNQDGDYRIIRITYCSISLV